MICKIYKVIAYIKACLKGQTIKQLRKKGAIIGENVNLLDASIDLNAASLIEIGNDVIITNAIILAHDASTKMHLGYTKIAKTKIGNNVFIGMGSIVLAGTKIGNNVIIGAGTVVRENIPDNSVVIGNPAKVICTTEEYIEKNRERMRTACICEKAVSELSDEEKRKLRGNIGDEVGFEL